MRKTSQATKVISALQSADYTDSGLTANEMKNKFGVSNARALVTQLRQNGFAVY